jgi:RNA polymerase sigma factor (sigma-70 family)
MMRQAATWAQGKATPGELPPTYFGGSFLVAVPFRAFHPEHDRIRSAGSDPAEAKTNPSGSRARPATRWPWHGPPGQQATTITIVVMQGTATFTETVCCTAALPPDVESRARARGDVDLELLRSVQSYLACLGRRQPPGASEREAWQRFYDQYDAFIRRVVCSSLGKHAFDADADDCVQEVWAELVTKLARASYDPRRGRFAAWLFSFARRKAIRFLRRKARHATRSLADPAATLAGRDGDPQAHCERQENRDLVHRMLAQLRGRVSETNYRILHLRWMEGRTSAEIAAAVNVSQDQVRYRLGRMKRKLRALLKAHSPAGDTSSSQQ